MKLHRQRRGRCGPNGLLLIGALGLCCYLFARDRSDVVLFGGRNIHLSEEFTGTEVTTVFGGYKLDLRDATLPRGRAVIDMNTVFGGAQVIVPEDWNVIVENRSIFGGFEDRTRHPAESVGINDVIFRGTTMFGGVQIRN